MRIALFFCAVSWATFACADEPSPKPKVKRTPSGIVISKETTFVTGPLDENGYVDYSAVLDQKLREGVTPENNAAVLFAQAFGPEMFPEDSREDRFRQLGIPVPPAKGNYFVSHFEANLPLSIDEQIRQVGEANSRPWSKEEFPHLVPWLEQNRIPLELIAQAVRRQKHYVPPFWAGHERGLDGRMYPMSFSGKLLTLWKIYLVRAMYHIKLGKTQEAMEDLLTIRRMARLMQSTAESVYAMLGMAAEMLAIQGEQQLLFHGKLTAKQIQQYAEHVHAIPSGPSMAEHLNFQARILLLDQLQWLSRQEGGLIHQLRRIEDIDYAGTQWSLNTPTLWKLVRLDWTLMMKMGNDHFDAVIAARQLPTREQQNRAFHDLDLHWQILLKQYPNDLKSLMRVVLKTSTSPETIPEAITQQIGGALIVKLMDGYESEFTWENRLLQSRNLNQIGFALARYKADHGIYPKTLEILKPNYLKTIPIDFFSGKSPIYRTTQEGYLLYSVSENEADDQGLSIREAGSVYAGDLILPMPPED